MQSRHGASARQGPKAEAGRSRVTVADSSARRASATSSGTGLHPVSPTRQVPAGLARFGPDACKPCNEPARMVHNFAGCLHGMQRRPGSDHFGAHGDSARAQSRCPPATSRDGRHVRRCQEAVRHQNLPDVRGESRYVPKGAGDPPATGRRPTCVPRTGGSVRRDPAAGQPPATTAEPSGCARGWSRPA